jgi:aldehyde:ferredoxin oxidoreductase
MFVFGPGNIYSFGEMTDMVNAATGLNISFKDLMKIGEESLQLQRKLYTQFGGKDEEFLGFLEKEIPSGPSKGAKISENDFSEARNHYYSLWNW